MQKLQCEVCGGNELVKEGEYFVCQHCGTKYTKESLKEMMNLNVKVEVNDKHWEEAKEQASAEAEQLDYEISLIENEFMPLYNKYVEANNEFKTKNNRHTLSFVAAIAFFLISELSVVLLVIAIIIGLSCAFIFYPAEKAAKVVCDKAQEAAEQKRNELRGKITLIPEKFWPAVEVVRDYNKNWGATNQRDLLNHLEEHFRKPDVIERTVYVEK